MNSSEILETFREEMNDEAEPYLWPDRLLFRYLDEAQKNFCRFTEGIEDSATAEITRLSITAATEWYDVDKRVLKVREAADVATGRSYKVYNAEEATDAGVLFDGRTGPLRALVAGLTKNKLRAWPVPNANSTVELRVFRLPLLPITDAGDEELEIDEQHHMALLMWMKHRAYGKEDAETFDRSKRDDFEERFRRYCAEAKAEQGRLRHQAGVVHYGGL